MLKNKFMLSEKRKQTTESIFSLVSISLLVLISLFIASCSGSGGYMSNTKEINYYQGDYGLELSFLSEEYLNEIYEESPFTVNILVENLGASDVVEENQAILSLGYDPFYFNTSDLKNLDGRDNSYVTIRDGSIIVKGLRLYGKSRYYPSGSDLFLAFPNFKVKKILGQRESPQSSIFASLCYPYKTFLSEMVCVDLNTFGDNLRNQICTQQDLSLSDQGAPVAIRTVEVENQPVGSDLVRPVFTIHISNDGSGTVLSPAYSSEELERVCTFEEVNRDDFNTIEVKATLSDSKELECKPNPVKLFDGDGVTRCTVKENELIMGHSNFQTTLSVELSYVYLTAISKDISIKKINVYGENLNSVASKCSPSQIEEGGVCRNKCDYCNDHPTSTECQMSVGTPVKFELGGFACMCEMNVGGKNSCASLSANGKGLCAPRGNFCSGVTFCCRPECSSSEVWVKDAKACLPKCPSSTTCDRPASKKCYIGSSEQPIAVESGDYYCTLDNVLKSFGSDKSQCQYSCVK